MSLSADTIIDRIKLKEQLARWRSAVFLLVVLLGLVLVSRMPSSAGNSGLVGRSYIAKILVEGIIQQDDERDQILKEITENKNIKAVILEVNSPGGTMVGSELLYERLQKLEKAKPLVVVMQEVAASGGYMVSIAADRVFAQRGTITGSIGVLLQMAEVTELAEKWGITLHAFKSSPLKGSPSPLEKLTPEVTQEVDRLIKANYDIFVDIVAQARPIKKTEVLALSDGRVYTGIQAVENKLVDGIGGEEEALAWLEEKGIKHLPVKEVKLFREKSEWEKAFTSFTGWKESPLSAAGFLLKPKGVLALWQPGVL